MEKELHFSWINSLVFGGMLAISAIIGIYFGFFSKKKQDNTVQYLLGGKKMNFFPIAASLIASHVSGATFLAVPAEVYAFGSEYFLTVICAIMLGLAAVYIYLPVFYDLQLTSSFEYLEKRFCRKVRLLTSSIYITSRILFIPIVIYVPALAFSQVSGIHLHIVTIVTSLICVFYTTIGGLKAVVWTDTLQFITMVGGLVAVTVLGLISTGGFANVWRTADEGGRLIFFNMNPSPFVRTSFWTYSIGMTSAWIAGNGLSQCTIQRIMSVPSIKVAKQSILIFVVGLCIIKTMSCFGGLIIYARYATCDPVKSGAIQKIDQILPYFVMDVADKIPGLPGLFIAGIFSAALSSMSSGLNTISGTIYEDFIRHHYPNNSEKRASDIMKILVIILGIIMIGLVFVVEHMGQVFRLNFVMTGMFLGTQLGIFSLGMFSRTANTKGVICGAVCAVSVVATIAFGSQSLPKAPPLPVSIAGCDPPVNATITDFDRQYTAVEEIPLIFRLSFMYYCVLGLIIFIFVALSVSKFTGGCEEFDERLLTPFVRSKNWKEKHASKTVLNACYEKVPIELKEVNLKEKSGNI